MERLCQSCGNVLERKPYEWPAKFAKRRFCNRTCSNTKHGGSRSVEYYIWHGMMQRCRNPSHHKFHMYGGAGVDVCESWNDFGNFFRDMGPRPSKQYSIDRIDGSKGYSKENCRWATALVQQNNLKNNRLITIDGVTKTVSQWARVTGQSRALIDGRLRLGWEPERAVMQEKGKHSWRA